MSIHENAGAASEAWKVGALASATGLTVRALHYYDEIGLLKPSRRTTAGHRLYDPADVARLYTTGLLVYDDINTAHDYIVRVFGLSSGHVEADPDGSITYREVRAGHQVIGLHRTVSAAFRSPRSLGAVTGMTVIAVDDADAHYARSVLAGAEIIEEPVDQPYGIREYGARDPEGQLWYFHSPLG